jgi:hypothetical protein
MLPTLTTPSAFRALALLAFPICATAQVTQLTHPNQFTATSTLLTFEDALAPVTEQYANLGVHFELTNGNGCGVFSDPVPRTFGPSGSLALNNLGQGDVGMEITFDVPVQRLGFEVRNGADEDLVVTLTVLSDGLVVDSRSFDTGLAYTFVAQESVVGFDHVLLDVTGGAGTGSFLIDNLRFESYVACEAAFLSEGFESGTLDGWETLGAAGVVTSEIGTAPSNGRYCAMISTAAGNGATGVAVPAPNLEAFFQFPAGLLGENGHIPFEGSGIKTEPFVVSPGDVLRVRWNFLTSEETPAGESNDFAFVSLLTGGGWLLVDTLDPDFQPTVTPFGEESGWRTYELIFGEGGTMCLGFGVVNALDGLRDSALLVDCVLADGMPPANHAPVCSVDFTQAAANLLQVGPNAFVVTEGHTLTVGFSALDDDADPLTVSADGLPATALLTPGAGSIASATQLDWTPMSADKALTPLSIEVGFTDPDGEACTQFVTVADVNLNPVASAGGDVNGEITVQSLTAQGTTLTLGGSAVDPDDTDLLFHWDVSDASVVLDDPESATPTGTFPLGLTLATLTVTDGRGGLDTSDVLVSVIDTVAPAVVCTSDKATLLPANHAMVPVQLVVQATDINFDPEGVAPLLVTVRSNEPDDVPNDLGDGATTGDVNGFDGYVAPVDVTAAMVPDPLVPGRYTGTIFLRAELHIRGTGRKYTVDALASDTSGNTAQSSAVVVVPNRRKF